MEISIVYMASGLSSRFGGKAKQLAKVGPNGETLLEYSATQAINAGFNKIILVVGEKTEQALKEIFKDNYKGVIVEYAKQELYPEKRDGPWGTADAACTPKHLINGPFVVCNGDDIYGENTLRTLVEHAKQSTEPATIGYTMHQALPDKGPGNRAIYQMKGDYLQKLNEVYNIEKTNLEASNLTPEHLCSMNIFLLNSIALDHLSKQLVEFKEQHKDERKKECVLPNEISKMLEQEKIKMKVYPAIDQWIGLTYPEDEVVVKEFLRQKHAL